MYKAVDSGDVDIATENREYFSNRPYKYTFPQEFSKSDNVIISLKEFQNAGQIVDGAFDRVSYFLIFLVVGLISVLLKFANR